MFHFSQTTPVTLYPSIQKIGATSPTLQPLSVEPLAFEVTLPDSDSSERVEVVGFRPSKNAAFFVLKGCLPLGPEMEREWVVSLVKMLDEKQGISTVVNGDG